MTRLAVTRASDALKLAASDSTDRQADDKYLARVLHSLSERTPLPSEIQRDQDRFRERGVIGEHGGILVPLHRIFGKAFRDLTTSTSDTPKAGNLIGVDVPQIVPELATFPAVMRAGATVLAGLRGNTSLPALTTAAAIEWMSSETTAPTEGSATFANTSLVPRLATGYIDISRRLVKQSPMMEAAVRAHLARGIGRLIDAAALTGDGTNGAPTGIVNTTNVTQVAMDTNGAVLSRAKLRDLVKAVTDARGLQPESLPAFMLNGDTLAHTYATETSTGSGRYLYEPSDATRGTLGGWPGFLNEALPDTGTKGTGTNLSTVVFGDWRQCILGFWETVELFVNPYVGSSSNTLRVHAFATLDVGIAQPTAFSFADDVVTV